MGQNRDGAVNAFVNVCQNLVSSFIVATKVKMFYFGPYLESSRIGNDRLGASKSHFIRCQRCETEPKLVQLKGFGSGFVIKWSRQGGE
jgi:hypothetical protein